MAPLRTALAIALLAALGGAIGRSGAGSPTGAAPDQPRDPAQLPSSAPGPPKTAPTPKSPKPPAARQTQCPPGTLQDQRVCVPVPTAQLGPSTSSALERIPLLPGRPRSFASYRLPVALPDESKKQPAPSLGADGFVELELGAEQPARLIALEGQVGRATLFEVDALAARVATLHQAVTAGREHGYLVVLGGVKPTAPTAAPGAPLETTAELGNASGPALVLGVFRLRREADVASLTLELALEPAHSIAIDPRNVLVPVAPP